MNGRRALVVDDDDSIRNMLARIIERMHIEVDTARDGIEAMEMLDRDGYGVVLLDLMMPRADGFAVLEHMRQNHSEALRHTIVASAIPEIEAREHIDGPVYKFHPKPSDVGALLSDIRACADTI